MAVCILSSMGILLLAFGFVCIVTLTMTEKGLTMKIRDVWPLEVAEKIDGGVASAQAIIAAGEAVSGL